VNLFAYCGGNPTSRIDKNGADSEWCGFSDGFFGLASSECHVAPEVKSRVIGGLKATRIGFQPFGHLLLAEADRLTRTS